MHSRSHQIAGLGGALLLFLRVMPAGHGGITYDRQHRILRVTDCLQSVPCTPRALWLTDRMNGWGCTEYASETDTYTLDADLWIGSNDGAETHFQVGSAEHPRETLVVRGHVIISPFHIPGEGQVRDWRSGRGAVNRLTIGVEGNPEVRPVLKIFSEPGSEHTLYVGRTPAALTGLERGGELHVYHGTITAAVQDKDHMIGSPGKHRVLYMAGRVVLKHAVLSWIAGKMAYGMRGAILENTTFENGGTAILGRKHTLTGCTFRNLQTAILDYGNLDITLRDCVFENNRRNWSLRFTGQGLTCIDCTWDAPALPNEYRSYLHPKMKRTLYPTFLSRRHVVVAVVDEQGGPVKGADVSVACEQEVPETVTNDNARTDAAGRTPGQGSEHAILLTEVMKRATDTPMKPAVTEYSYEVRVHAPGSKETVVSNVRPTESWQTVRVQLAR